MTIHTPSDPPTAEARPPEPPPGGMTEGDLVFLMEHGVPLAVITQAVHEARAAGVSADTALIAGGHVDEDLFYRAVAQSCGLPFIAEPKLAGCPTDPALVLASGHAMTAAGELCRTVSAPKGAQLSALIRMSARGFGPPGLGVTSPSRLAAAVLAAAGPQVAHQASHDLGDRQPNASYRGEALPGEIACLLGIELVVAALVSGFPDEAAALLHIACGSFILSFLSLRAVPMTAAGRRLLQRPHSLLADMRLPTYCVLVPLHKEGPDVVAGLINALAVLDYPPAKLDVLLLVEAGDAVTHDALARCVLPAFVRTIVCPPGHPRTKPRALNIGLRLSAGDLVVVFDAEDRPEPDQLRRAATRFARLPDRIGCLQAALAIQNDHEGWIPRIFALEYALLFGTVIPGMARLAFPIALGGTSNHFRRAALVQCGGWDAWNVTEDADLGFRLHRRGIGVASLESHTREEAPTRLRTWFGQRRRWMKGWVQTAIVHSRRGTDVALPAGDRLLLIGLAFGTVLSALMFPLFVISGAALMAGIHPALEGGLLGALAGGFAVVVFAAGAAYLVVGARLAARHSGVRLTPGDAVLALAYLCLICAAAWVALFDLVREPFHWAKTDHGQAARGPKR